MYPILDHICKWPGPDLKKSDLGHFSLQCELSHRPNKKDDEEEEEEKERERERETYIHINTYIHKYKIENI